MKGARSLPQPKIQNQQQNLYYNDMKYLVVPSHFKKLSVPQNQVQEMKQRNELYLSEIQRLIEDSPCINCQKLCAMVQHCLVSMGKLLSKSKQLLNTDTKIQKLHHQLDLCQNNVFTKIMLNNIQPIISYYSKNENQLLQRQQSEIENLKLQYQNKINLLAITKNETIQNLIRQLRNKQIFIDQYKKIIEYLCDLNIQLKTANNDLTIQFDQTPQPI